MLLRYSVYASYGGNIAGIRQWKEPCWATLRGRISHALPSTAQVAAREGSEHLLSPRCQGQTVSLGSGQHLFSVWSQETTGGFKRDSLRGEAGGDPFLCLG